VAESQISLCNRFLIFPVNFSLHEKFNFWEVIFSGVTLYHYHRTSLSPHQFLPFIPYEIVAVSVFLEMWSLILGRRKKLPQCSSP